MPDHPPAANHNPRQNHRLPPFVRRGAVVGTIHSPGGARAAQLLPAGTLSAAEIRLDAFTTPHVQAMIQALQAAPSTRDLPLILTPRCSREGGLRPWEESQRLDALLPVLPAGHLVDLELRELSRLPRLLEAVQKVSCPLLLSLHDFEGTPSAEVLRQAREEAADAGACLFKVATTLRAPSDLAALLALLDPAPAAPPLPTAVMAMGPLGQSSRLLLADAGSVLNYGWLDVPQVSGQWSAPELHELFVRLGFRPASAP